MTPVAEAATAEPTTTFVLVPRSTDALRSDVCMMRPAIDVIALKMLASSLDAS